jgi:uncharacterized protein GlcG (DUF336 family)
MNVKVSALVAGVFAGAMAVSSLSASAACSDFPNHAALKTMIATVADARGGYDTFTGMWLTIVDETGKVCDVISNKPTVFGSAGNSVNSGAKAGNTAWLGSRVISAQKANTANAFSLDGYAIGSANLYAAVKEGSLYGLQHSNPVDASRAYQGDPAYYGTAADPLIGKRIGGVNVFGGGLPVYKSGVKVGAIGVSGDTSCADHVFAWHIRTSSEFAAKSLGAKGTGITTFNVDATGAGQTPLTGATGGDEMIITSGTGNAYWDAWAQPGCPGSSHYNAATDGVLYN